MQPSLIPATPGTCSACAYWGQEGTGVCSAPQSALVRVGVVQEPNGFNVYATADDDSNLCAELVTGPAFGCNRFALRCPVCEGKRHTLDAKGYWAGSCKACNGTGCEQHGKAS